jgi:hypothetical protein
VITRERSVNRFFNLDFTAHGVIESISEFGLRVVLPSHSSKSD